MLKLAIPVLWLGLGALAGAQAVLTPPFGLKWGDTPESLIEWAGRHALDVRITLPGKEPRLRIIRIEPEEGLLPASEARALEARFESGRLFEVAIHYGRPADGADAVRGQFDGLRRKLTAEYGKFTANKAVKTIDDKFATRAQSYHREPVKGLFLLLAFTEVEDLLRQSREATFSIVYRNDNLREQLLGGSTTGGGQAGSQ